MRLDLPKIFAEPEARFQLGRFRVVLGILFLVEAVWTLPSVHELYGAQGFLQSDLMRAIAGWTLPNTFESWGADYRAIVSFVAFLHLVSAFFFAMGRGYRAAAVGLWLTTTFFMNSGHLSNYGVNRYLHLFSFLAVCLPLNADLQPSRRDHSGELWIFRLALSITYLHAGVSKMMGADWWTGDAIWRAINLPEFRQQNVWWLGAYPALFKIAGWSTLFFEILYLPAVFFRQLRGPWIAIICLMHVGISLFLGLHFFALTMILLNVSLYVPTRASHSANQMARFFPWIIEAIRFSRWRMLARITPRRCTIASATRT